MEEGLVNRVQLTRIENREPKIVNNYPFSTLYSQYWREFTMCNISNIY